MILFPAPSINNKDNNDVCFHLKYVMKHCTISSSFVVVTWMAAQQHNTEKYSPRELCQIELIKE